MLLVRVGPCFSCAFSYVRLRSSESGQETETVDGINPALPIIRNRSNIP